jgi:Uncharacterised nucleotidyltransferase
VNSAPNAADDPRIPVLSFGLLQPRHSDAEAIMILNKIGPADAADLLYEHKVSSLAKAKAQRIANDASPSAAAALTELAAELTRAAEPRKLRWESADRVRQLVTAVAAAGNVDWWTMKGFSFRDRYPIPQLRDVGDLDVLVSTLDDAWRLTRGLRATGYIYLDAELPWFKKDVVTGQFYGQVRLTTPRKDRLSIDIHAGPYSIRHCGVMRMRRSGARGSGSALDFADDVCAVIANAAGDCFVPAKLANDLVLALDADLDYEYVHETLGAAGLLPFFAMCMDLLPVWCDLTPEQGERYARLVPAGPREPKPPLDAADSASRTEVTVAHAGQMARRLFPDDPRQAEAIEATARAAYETEYPLRLVDTGPAGLPESNNWTCIRLVPVELAGARLGLEPGTEATGALGGTSLSAEMERVDLPEGTLVRVGEDVFIPTVDFALPERLVRAARAQAPLATG